MENEADPVLDQADPDTVRRHELDPGAFVIAVFCRFRDACLARAQTPGCHFPVE